jgi:hypothetical protein
VTTWRYLTIDLASLPAGVADVDQLNEVGRQSWELVSITPNGIAYLRRPIEERGAQKGVRMKTSIRPRRRQYLRGQRADGTARVPLARFDDHGAGRRSGRRCMRRTKRGVHARLPCRPRGAGDAGARQHRHDQRLPLRAKNWTPECFFDEAALREPQ